jgi:hypothetical protein
LQLSFLPDGPDVERLAIDRATIAHLTRKPHPEALQWLWQKWIGRGHSDRSSC